MAVTIEKIDVALIECARFIRRARAARKALAGRPSYGEAPKETGAVRRASMDLTRSLVDIRK